MIPRQPLYSGARPEQTCCPIVELRQYTLYPGKRDGLIELFDREFVESQEAVGMRVIGQFRDLDEPNRFVWLRGFQDMSTRAQALSAFYDGPVWKAHREAANATMIDSDNVLLLRPARPGSGFPLENDDRPPPGTNTVGRGLVVATICYFDAPPETGFFDWFERALQPVLTETGAPVLADFVTENSPNNFPRLPVREGEHVFLWFSRFPDQTVYGQHVAALAQSRPWCDKLEQVLAQHLKRSPEVLKLAPTARSQLHS